MTDSEIIKAIRTETGLSQRDMAARLGVSQSALSSIEVGRNPIYHELFKKIVLELNVNPWFFVKDNQTVFLTGTGESNALKKKLDKYEKLIDKLIDVKGGK
ncbi:MAG: helix-turn-helix transcriptional regulator [Agriterribacter sp.]